MRSQATLSGWRKDLSKYYKWALLPEPSLHLKVTWLLCGPAGDLCKGRWGRWAVFPLGALLEKQATKEV